MADARAAQIARIQQIERIKALEAQKASPGEEPSNWDTAKDLSVGGVQHLSKAYDYQGGATRMGIAKILEGLTGKQLVMPGEAEDMANPLSKNVAPNSSEYLKRLGVPEGAALSNYLGNLYAEKGDAHPFFQPEKGGMLDPTVRGTIGTGLDIMTDPLTYETMGESAAARMLKAESAQALARGNLNNGIKDRMVNLAKSLGSSAPDASPWAHARAAAANVPITMASAPSNAAEYLGAKMFKSGVHPLDVASVESGKAPISDVLMKDGAWGSSGTLQQHILDQAEAYKNKAGELAASMDKLDPIDRGPYGKLRGGVDMGEAMQNADTAVSNLKGRPVMADAAGALENSIDTHKALDHIPRARAAQLKADLYSTLPDSAFDQAVRTPPGAVARGQMARGIKEGMEKVPTGASPELSELASQMKPTTERWGDYLTVGDAADKMARKSQRTPFFSKTDARLGMLSTMGAGAHNAGTALAGIKLSDLIRATPVKTGMGLGLNNVAGSATGDFLDSLLRRKIIDDNAPNTWAKMRGDQNE